MVLLRFWLQPRPQDGAALEDHSQVISTWRPSSDGPYCIWTIKYESLHPRLGDQREEFSAGSGQPERKGLSIDGGKNEFESTRSNNRTGVGGGTGRGCTIGVGPGRSARTGACIWGRGYRSGRILDLPRRVRMGFYFRLVAQATVRVCPAARVHRVLHRFDHEVRR